MVGALFEAPCEDVPRARGQGGDIAQELDAHVLAMEQRQLVDERLGEEVHERIDLVLRPIPVLSGEGVGGEHVDTQPNRGGDDLAKRHDPRLVALGAGEPARGGPATVAIHDARDMPGDTGEVYVGERDV